MPAQPNETYEQASHPKSTDTLQQPVLVGRVINVIDGDTIKVQLSSGPINVRFDSIDAPEMSQPWGPESRSRLVERIDEREVTLEVTEQDHYNRLVAVVYVGNESLNGWMVRQGNAWAYREYLSDDEYCDWEGRARSLALGLWGLSDPTQYAPWEWRRMQRGELGVATDYSNETVENCLAAARALARAFDAIVLASTEGPAASPPAKCLIKGNISERGRIYHVPGSRWYGETQIDPSKGERWFCTVEEAVAAGWRAPKA